MPAVNEDNYQPLVFDQVKIGLASPDTIRSWSRGVVTKPETINYRTLKPERDGLFCERIFGPSKDWECHCGKYKKIRYKGVICDRCGVEVTKSSVRRERMGHIELAAPVSHIWYFKGIPSRMGLILDLSPRVLEKVLYFASYIVLDKGNTTLADKQVLTEREYRDAQDQFKASEGYHFRVGMGAEAIQELLKRIDLEQESAELRAELENAKGQKEVRIVKRLEVVEAFRKSGNKPEWMVMNVIPVLPPDLRPMVQLDGGRFATSDLNDLYRRIINRNNRLARLLELGAPDIIVRNEKRMLQEAVDALIDNGRRGRPVVGPGNRALKSLSDMLKGKQGRFRQNLLGKRVDYSGRSVIVVGPELKIYQCGLPKEMAIELFKPFVMRELTARGIAHNIKSAKKMVERMDSQVFDVLEDVIRNHPVMLNRAPTLHRLGIQAFEPILVEGKAIKLHPLVCTAYNADFDGDQMAVHLPLSQEAQAECRFMLLSPNNLLKPSDGGPVAVPSQDMVLGIYYLTQERPGSKGEGKHFKDLNEALLAFENKELTKHSRITVRCTKTMEDGTVLTRNVESTLGRFMFNEIIPQDLGFVDRSVEGNELNLEIDFHVGKKQLKKILQKVINVHGVIRTAEVLDDIKAIGYKHSTLAALTVSIADMTVPETKAPILADAQKKVDKINKNFRRGFTSEEERYKQVIEVWNKADEQIKKDLLGGLDKYNNIFMMADSGARGSDQQIKQLAGMRGLMADTQGRTIELPIKSNFREGLDVLEYFVSAHGARKGMSDTALRTADSGYLTRRLVDVSQDVIIREMDCAEGKDKIPSQEIREFRNKKELIESLQERITGRTLAEDITDPQTGEVIAEKNLLIRPAMADKIMSCWIWVDNTVEALTGRTAAEKIVIPAYEEEQNGITMEFAEESVGAGKMIFADEAEKIAAHCDQKQIKVRAYDSIKIRTALSCRSHLGVCAKCYGANLATGLQVQIGEAVGIIAAQSIGEPGTQLTMRTFHTGGVAGNGDITQGLPRVEELFEARKPKVSVTLAGKDGIYHLDDSKKKREVVITDPDTGETWRETIPYNARTPEAIRDGMMVHVGDYLTEGSVNPHELLALKGVDAVQNYMLSEVQSTYRLQGVEISDKHIEVIVRQMLKKVRIEEPGDSSALKGTTMGVLDFDDMNEALTEEGKEPATGTQIMLGITKASLATDSFLSAASFQETTKVLTEAAINGKIDYLRGLKENVLIGQLIPAGTGMRQYRTVKLDVDGSELMPVIEQEEEAEGIEAENGEVSAEAAENVETVESADTEAAVEADDVAMSEEAAAEEIAADPE